MASVGLPLTIGLLVNFGMWGFYKVSTIGTFWVGLTNNMGAGLYCLFPSFKGVSIFVGETYPVYRNGKTFKNP